MYERILVPVDGSPTSNAGLAEAIKLAKLAGARLRLIHVIDDMPLIISAEGSGSLPQELFAVLKETGSAILDAARKEVEASGVAVDCFLFESLRGRLCSRVAEQVKEWDANLIALGTHGRRGVGRVLMGSDAEQIVRTAMVPVLLVRGPNSSSDLVSDGH